MLSLVSLPPLHPVIPNRYKKKYQRWNSTQWRLPRISLISTFYYRIWNGWYCNLNPSASLIHENQCFHLSIFWHDCTTLRLEWHFAGRFMKISGGFGFYSRGSDLFSKSSNGNWIWSEGNKFFTPLFCHSRMSAKCVNIWGLFWVIECHKRPTWVHVN